MYVGSSSSYYIQNLQWAKTNGTTGSKWNLKNGHFDAKGSGGSIAIHPNSASGLFVVKNSDNKIILNVGDTYYLQSIITLENGNTIRILILFRMQAFV